MQHEVIENQTPVLISTPVATSRREAPRVLPESQPVQTVWPPSSFYWQQFLEVRPPGMDREVDEYHY